MSERTTVKEFYKNPQDFLEDLNSINTRKLIHQNDKDLIRKLKRWVKEYWKDDGSMNLYESQYARLQMFKEALKDIK
jgi:glucan phosphorylase